MAKIIGNTTATPNPRPDWTQTDSTKADFIKNKPTLGALAAKSTVAKTDLATDVQKSLNKADSAIQSVEGLATENYVEEQISKIPTPDVSGQINTHDNSTTAHTDIRDAIPKTLSQLTGDANHRTITDAEKEMWNAKATPEYVDTALADVVHIDETDNEKIEYVDNLKDELKEYINNELAEELAKRGQLKPEFANSIEECTDTSKLYVLPDGYIYGYMKKYIPSETIPNFTNLMDDPNAYIKNGYRYSNSSAAFKECSTDCAIVVPITKQSTYTFRTLGCSYDGSSYPNSFYFGNSNS